MLFVDLGSDFGLGLLLFGCGLVFLLWVVSPALLVLFVDAVGLIFVVAVCSRVFVFGLLVWCELLVVSCMLVMRTLGWCL